MNCYQNVAIEALIHNSVYISLACYYMYSNICKKLQRKTTIKYNYKLDVPIKLNSKLLSMKNIHDIVTLIIKKTCLIITL